MKLKYFGDSYDIVKKSMIHWLSEFGPWVTHPMFTETVKSQEAAAFSRLLGTPLLSTETLTAQTDRSKYFASCGATGNLFLDPDTGVRLQNQRGEKSVAYVFAEELVDWCRQRPHSLTLIFDQSYSRGDEDGIRRKLSYLGDKKIHGFAYNSHATFLLLGTEDQLVKRAHERVLAASGLPAWRLVLRKGTRIRR